MSRLFICTLRLIGTRKNYEINFKYGLNYISGPTSTGKTSILEMINYVLGAEKHKSYIEIGEACTEAELDVEIDGKKFRIKRKLFEFTLPVKIDLWDEEDCIYKYFDTYEIDVPSNEKSLSAFLINKLGLGDVKVANQFFSFRDLFKYSYLKQTDIDSEDLMGESIWYKNNKRKSTFEIIFNIYDEMVASLKASLKEKIEEKESFRVQLEGVSQFIDATDIGNISTYRSKRQELEGEIVTLKDKLTNVKADNMSDNDATSALRKKIMQIRNELRILSEQKNDQDEYINKLQLLLNQYQNDIDKYKMLLVGVPELNKYNFLVCPNCLKPIEKNENVHCAICNNDMTNDVSDLLQVKKEITLLKRRLTELKKHIASEQEKRNILDKDIVRKRNELTEETAELAHLQEGYVNPYIEQIEYLNFEIGKCNRKLQEIDTNLQMLEEYERLRKLMRSKEEDLTGIRKNINKLTSEQNDKSELIKELSIVFNSYLKEFCFPKLDVGYIEEKTYLPFVRGRKYNDLGSLGGVTLIVIAYYLSIMKMTLDADKFYHLNLLMIDSPRKNLGSDATQEEFRDEAIFNAIIKTFIEFEKQDGDKMQLIVVNNGYPEFVPKEDLIVRFDPKERIGLIDDAIR